jgi:hypothetical protein
MSVIVVERSFAEPVNVVELQEQENRHHGCLEMHGVVFLRTYVSSDSRRMICLYEAPDAEAVRRVNDVAQLAYDRVWAAEVMEAPPAQAEPEDPPAP